MAFVDLYSELTGCVPKLDVDLAKKLVNRAWADVRRKNLWSFQLFEANWVSPNVLTTGTVTVTQGANTVVFDAAAIAAIDPISVLGPFPTPLSHRQFRIGVGTIYNIWGWDSGTGTMTLDRPYAESSGAGQTYSIYQCYYQVPYTDFLSFINVRDMTNYNDLDIWTTRNEIDLRDPQRTIYYLPTHVVYYQQHQNATSEDYGMPLFELWGQPQYQIVYQLYGIRKGTDLINDDDRLPFAIGEDCVIENAKAKAYEWAEANKGEVPRSAGADFRFLIGGAKKEFDRLWHEYRRQDMETVNNWFTIRRRRPVFANVGGFFNSIGNTANPGLPW